MSARVASRKLYAFHMFLQHKEEPLRRDRSMKWLRRLARRIWRREGFKQPLPKIVAGRGSPGLGGFLNSYWEGFYGNEERIVLTRDNRNVGVLLHELCHVVVRRGYPHGPTFQRLNFHLLQRYGGIKMPLLMAAALVRLHNRKPK